MGRKGCKMDRKPKDQQQGQEFAGKAARRQEAQRPAEGTRIGQERVQDQQQEHAGIGKDRPQDGQEVQKLAGGAGRWTERLAGSPKDSRRDRNWAGKAARWGEAKRPAAEVGIGQERLKIVRNLKD